MQKLSDQKIRLAALDIEKSFLVTAPAGSGKTELLTQRVLKLLAIVDKPEDILCITFTRKAAGEMQARIISNLIQGTQEAPSEPHRKQTWLLAQNALARDKEKGWRLLATPARFSIQTIDSLCSRLTQTMPLLSSFGTQCEVTDDPLPLYKQAVSGLFLSLDRMGEDDPVVHSLQKLMLHLDNHIMRIEPLLTELLIKRDQWLPILGAGLGIQQQEKEFWQTHLRCYIEDRLEVFRQQLKPFYPQVWEFFQQLSPYLNQSLTPDWLVLSRPLDQKLPDAKTEELHWWRTFAQFFLTKTPPQTFRKRQPLGTAALAAKTKIEKEQAKVFKNAFVQLVDVFQNQNLESDFIDILMLPETIALDLDDGFIQALAVLLPRLVAELYLVFNQHQVVDFPLNSQKALDALGALDDPSDLALKLDYRIAHILVDEFQDTSQTQLALLEQLTQTWLPGDGRTLFLVGDGMQSCYGFRDAHVGLFLQVRSQGLHQGQVPVTPLALSSNFRSQKPIVDWLNQVFPKVFPERDLISRGAVKYTQCMSVKEDQSSQVLLHFFQAQQKQGLSSEEVRAYEANKVATLTQQLLEEDTEQTVAILVRSRSHLAAILPALSKQGLSWQATDIDPLQNKALITDLISLAKALSNTSDRLSWLAILRAPWCGLTTQDLWAVANATLPHLTVFANLQAWPNLALSIQGKKLVQRFLQVIEPAMRERQRKSLRQWIYGVWVALGGPATAAHQGALTDISTFFELLDRFDQGGLLVDWEAFDERLGQLFAAPDPYANERLKIMTIHKSKGLEFDQVIIPGLDRQSQGDSKPLLLWHEHLGSSGQQALLMAAAKSQYEQKHHPVYQLNEYEKKQRTLLEAGRLLYVGCTRAVKGLHLVGSLFETSKGEVRQPTASSLLAALWPAIRHQASEYCEQIDLSDAAAPVVAETSNISCDEKSKPQRLSLAWKGLPFEQSQLLSAYRGTELIEDQDENIPTFIPLDVEKIQGVIIHDFFQQVGQQKQLAQLELIPTYRSRWFLQLQQQGLNQQRALQAIGHIETCIRHTIEDDKFHWLFIEPHLFRCHEFPVSCWRNQDVQHFIVDLALITLDKVLWVIDFKSAKPSEDQTKAGFLSEQLTTYQKQLYNYRYALSQYPKLQEYKYRHIRLALYFPYLKELVEVG